MTKEYKVVTNFEDDMGNNVGDVLEVTETRTKKNIITKTQLEAQKAQIDELLAKFTK